MKLSTVKRHIIGITGPFGSGKSTAASYFVSKGYYNINLSSFLEKEATIRGLKSTRRNLQDLGNELRERQGAGILLKKAFDEAKGEDKLVIDGLRNLAEVKILKENNGVLLAII